MHRSMNIRQNQVRRSTVLGLILVPLLALTSGIAMAGASSSSTWGPAQEVPNSASLNVGGDASVQSISCSSDGNCSAGGTYVDGSGNQQAFVVNKTNGSWGSAEEVPNTSSLNTGGGASVLSISCSSAGNCSAGGYYFDGSVNKQAFVADEANGSWGNAIEVPNTSSLNVGGYASVQSISCSSAGNCSAGGSYNDLLSSGRRQAFVADESGGTWGQAQEVPNTSSLNVGGTANVNSISCSSAGNCSAGGFYDDGTGHQAFVADESGGTWGQAQEVPNTASLNTGSGASVNSISCSSAGNCSAGGSYVDGSGNYQAFVVDEANGTWGQAEEVPNTASLNTGSGASVNSISCSSAGNCSAGGSYDDGTGHQAFVADESGGT